MGNFNLPPYVPTVLMVVAVVVAVVLAYRLWSELKEDSEPATPFDLLSEFEEARAAGELDEDEFQRVRASLRKPGFEAARTKPRVDPSASPAPDPRPVDEEGLPEAPPG